MSVTALKQRRDEKQDERGALRTAIANAAAARSKLEGRLSALGKAREHVAAAQAKAETTRAAIERARESHAKRTVVALSAGKPPPESPMLKNARAVELAAEDGILAAEAAISQLGEEIRELDRADAVAQTAVIVAVNTLLADTVRAELARAQELQSALIVSRWTLNALVEQDEQLPSFFSEARTISAKESCRLAMGPIRDEVLRFLNIDLWLDDETKSKASEAAGAMRAYRLALRQSPDAKPELPTAPFRG
jgi:hypothetical protein